MYFRCVAAALFSGSVTAQSWPPIDFGALYYENAIAHQQEACAKRLPATAESWQKAVGRWKASHSSELNELRSLVRQVEDRIKTQAAGSQPDLPANMVMSRLSAVSIAASVEGGTDDTARAFCGALVEQLANEQSVSSRFSAARAAAQLVLSRFAAPSAASQNAP